LAETGTGRHVIMVHFVNCDKPNMLSLNLVHYIATPMLAVYQVTNF